MQGKLYQQHQFWFCVRSLFKQELPQQEFLFQTYRTLQLDNHLAVTWLLIQQLELLTDQLIQLKSFCQAALVGYRQVDHQWGYLITPLGNFFLQDANYERTSLEVDATSANADHTSCLARVA